MKYLLYRVNDPDSKYCGMIGRRVAYYGNYNYLVFDSDEYSPGIPFAMNLLERVNNGEDIHKNLVEEFVHNQLKTFKGASEEILTFIGNVLYHEGLEGCETVRVLFRAGYCYYFAVMLQEAFGGDIYWVKGRSHVVYYDKQSDIAYGIEGVFYDYNEGDLLPVDFLKDDLESFLHRGKDSVICDEINATCTEVGCTNNELYAILFDVIKDTDTVLNKPNLGDICRNWNYLKKNFDLVPYVKSRLPVKLEDVDLEMEEKYRWCRKNCTSLQSKKSDTKLWEEMENTYHLFEDL